MILNEYVMRKGKKIPVSELKPTSGLKVDVQCPECKVVRNVFFKSVAKAGHHYCQSCSVKTKLGRTLETGTISGKLTVINPSDKSGYSICKCECGNIKEVENYQIKSGRTRSCGCLRSENIKKFGVQPSGENHWNWQGGISSPRHLVMAKKKYKDWRTAVFEHDSYTCQKCGQVGRELRAHHIFSYSANPEKAYDADNGITFCETCHRKFHKTYGFNTNKEQLNKFLK